MTPAIAAIEPRPRMSLTIPLVALVLSFVTTAGGSYLTLQINSATTKAHMEATDRMVSINTADIKELVPKDQFVIAIADLKEQLADMKVDVKEIRRAVVVPR